MINKKTIVDQQESIANGIIQIRFCKQVIEGGVIISSQYHRTSLQPGDDLVKQMAVVNLHLNQMGWPSVEDYSSVQKLVDIKHTPEVIKSFKLSQEKNERV